MILVNHPRSIIKDYKSKFIVSKVHSNIAKCMILKDVYWITIFSLTELQYSFSTCGNCFPHPQKVFYIYTLRIGVRESQGNEWILALLEISAGYLAEWMEQEVLKGKQQKCMPGPNKGSISCKFRNRNITYLCFII